MACLRLHCDFFLSHLHKAIIFETFRTRLTFFYILHKSIMFYVFCAHCQCTSVKKTLSDETLGFPHESCVSLIKGRRSSSKSFASQNVICVRMSRHPGHLHASDSQNHCFRKSTKSGPKEVVCSGLPWGGHGPTYQSSNLSDLDQSVRQRH